MWLWFDNSFTDLRYSGWGNGVVMHAGWSLDDGDPTFKMANIWFTIHQHFQSQTPLTEEETVKEIKHQDKCAHGIIG